MKRIIKTTALGLLAGVGLAGSSEAAEILVSANIAVSTTWTNNNTYNLQNQIYVLPGATLTIQPGTVIASTTNLGGSLAVTKGARIIANGTKGAPIIFTSKADVATWAVDAGHPTGKDPTTGTLREGVNEWGNLTLMGAGYISENATAGNVPTCNASNVATMEGLIAGFPGDTKVLYGGGDDTDDSGSLEHVSFRYGGRVIGLNNELNGLSLGGIGSDTDISHVEIMNNVDDGVEVWGGRVNLSHLSIWNIGDDSLDIDQGYRGKVQHVLIVQGHSADASQGSGVGDNAIEHDGAEQSDWQPVTTTTIHHATVIGQPVDGDHGTAWRDNARVQYANCIFMDLGDNLVQNDNVDGDGGLGYGFNGTLSWADTWTTDWNAVPPHANDCPPGTYTAQVSGKLAQIKDSVFFRNLKGGGTGLQTDAAYAEALARGVFAPAHNNVLIPGFLDADSPVTALTRGAPVVKGGKTMLPVTFLDPRPANEAIKSETFPPGTDGFLDPVKYRGAFAPDYDWLNGWTASQAYGLTPAANPWTDMGGAKKGTQGWPLLGAEGTLVGGSPLDINLRNARPSAFALLLLGLVDNPVPFFQGTIHSVPWFTEVIVAVNANGDLLLPLAWPMGIPSGFEFSLQYLIDEPTFIGSLSLSNGLKGVTP